MLSTIASLLGTTTPAAGPGSLYAVYRFYLPATITLIVAAFFLLGLGILFLWVRRRGLASLAGLAGIGLIFLTLWVNYHHYPRPIIFSEQAMLTQLWSAYKGEYLEPVTGRTLDKQRENITTSEGQAYTMLRAVWMDDRPTFNTSFQWAKYNIQRPDRLFSWLFGERADGKFAVLTEQGGANTASDADIDIALALLFAYSRWQDSDYLAEAAAIIPAIWNAEVVTINGRPYLAANNVEKQSTSPTVILNPSYFAPYAFRIFAEVDPTHDWLALVDTSYEVINQSLELPLDRDNSAGLPPDWVTINRRTGLLAGATDNALSTNFGYDAMRLPWRIALDSQWFNEPRAATTLAKMEFLNRQWQAETKLASTYTHDGREFMAYESPAMYGGSLGFFLLTHPETATAIYRDKLLTLFDPDTTRWKKILSYYDDNIAWFGMGLYQGKLINLSENMFSENSFAEANIPKSINANPATP